MSNSRISYLYNLFLNQTASQNESEELKSFFNNSKHQNEIMLIMDEILDRPRDNEPELPSEKTQNIYNQIIRQSQANRPLRRWKIIAAAAIVLICIGFVGYLYVSKSTPTTYIANNKP